MFITIDNRLCLYSEEQSFGGIAGAIQYKYICFNLVSEPLLGHDIQKDIAYTEMITYTVL